MSNPNVADVLAGIARASLSKGDPDLMAYEWIARNASNLKAATEALGITIEEGPGFGERLFHAVKAALSASPVRGGSGAEGE